MCTIVVLYGVRDDFPVVLATNRDEFYARPATGPTRLLEQPVAVGGRDVSAGGTWMGVTASGFFVGVTNQRNFEPPRPDARSRGELVMRCLQLADGQAVLRELAQLDARRYNEFNLMFGDARGMWVAYGRSDAAQVDVQPLPTGLHVLPNDRLNSDEFPKCERVKELIEPALEAPWPVLRSRLERTLADDRTVPARAPDNAGAFFTDTIMQQLSAVCVRTPAYGSRSSTIVALEPGRCSHYLYADGPPDVTEFADVTALFTER